MTNGATTNARNCPNCGQDRPDPFCAYCGQSDRNYARSLRPVLGDLLHETFELDSRLSRTLKLLLFRPGRLTLEFSRNRRASYMSPVRLYIFASFAFFLLLSLVGDFDNVVMTGVSEAEGEALVSEPPSEGNLAAFRAALPPDKRAKVDDMLARPDNDFEKQAILDAASEDFPERRWIQRFMLLGMIDILHDPSVVPRRFVGNMPIAMFCLLPVLGLVLAVLYFRKKRFYVEHLVFAIHSQTFTFLLYAVALLLPESGPGAWVRAGCVLIPYPYFVIALRRYYENGWVLTVAKSIGVLMLYSLALVPAFLISVFVTT